MNFLPRQGFFLLGLTVVLLATTSSFADAPVFDIKTYRDKAFNYADKLFDREYAKLLDAHVIKVEKLGSFSTDGQIHALQNKLDADTAALRHRVDKARRTRMLKLEKYRNRELIALKKDVSKRLGKKFKIDMTGTPPSTKSVVDGKIVRTGPGLESDIDTRTYKIKEIDALEDAAVKRYGRKRVKRFKGSIHIENLDMTSFNKVQGGQFSASVRNDGEFMKNITRLDKANMRGKTLIEKRIGSGYVTDNLKKTHGYLKVKPQKLLDPRNPYPLRDIAKATQRNMETMGIKMPTEEAALSRHAKAVKMSSKTGRPFKIDFKDQIVLVNKGKLSADAVGIVPPSGSRQEQLNAMKKFQKKLTGVHKKSYQMAKMADAKWEKAFVKRYQKAMASGNTDLAARAKRQLSLKNADKIRDKIAILRNHGSTTLADLEGLKKVKMRGSGKEMWFDTTQNRYYNKNQLKQRVLQKEFKDLKRLKRKDLSAMLNRKSTPKPTLVGAGTKVRPKVMTGKQWMKSQMKVNPKYSRALGIVGFLATLPEAYKQSNIDTEKWITADDTDLTVFGKMSYNLAKYASGVGFIQKQWLGNRSAYLEKYADVLKNGTDAERLQLDVEAVLVSTGKVGWEVTKGMATMPVTLVKNIGSLEVETKGLIGDTLDKWKSQKTSKETANKLQGYKREIAWRALQSKRSFEKYSKSVAVTTVEEDNNDDTEADLPVDDALNLAYGKELYDELKQAQRDYGSAARKVKQGDKAASKQMTDGAKKVKQLSARLNAFIDDPETTRKTEMSKRRAAHYKRRMAKMDKTLEWLKASASDRKVLSACASMEDAMKQIKEWEPYLQLNDEGLERDLASIDADIVYLRQRGVETEASLREQMYALQKTISDTDDEEWKQVHQQQLDEMREQVAAGTRRPSPMGDSRNEIFAEIEARKKQKAEVQHAFNIGTYSHHPAGHSINTVKEAIAHLKSEARKHAITCHQQVPEDWGPLPVDTQTACDRMQDSIAELHRLDDAIAASYEHASEALDEIDEEIAQAKQRMKDDEQLMHKRRAEFARYVADTQDDEMRVAYSQNLADMDARIASGDEKNSHMAGYNTQNDWRENLASKNKWREQLIQRSDDGSYQSDYRGPSIKSMQEQRDRSQAYMQEQQTLCYQ